MLKKILIIMSLLAVFVCAGESSVILANKSVGVDEMSKSELAKIFLGTEQYWPDGSRVSIGYLNIESVALNQFFEEYVGKDFRKFKKYWIKKVFAGYGTAPRSFSSVQRAFSFLLNNEGAILLVTGYKKEQRDDVKIIAIDGKKELR